MTAAPRRPSRPAPRPQPWALRPPRRWQPPGSTSQVGRWVSLALLALLLAAPFIGLYPVFMMKVLCFALFACAFNLLLGYTGLLSFGHAAFFGAAAYVTGWLVRSAGPAARARPARRAWLSRRCSAWSSAGSPSAARASTSR